MSNHIVEGVSIFKTMIRGTANMARLVDEEGCPANFQ
jgi:hypothetical protein